jgi:quercetin dioxygenase-like cupin family protein
VFAVYEMTIKPEAKIPIHIHPYAEFFYVLEGQVDVMGIDPSGALTWTPVSAGECANAPANAPHGIKNRSTQPAKFLSVSNFEHEKPFNDYQALVKTPEGQSMSEGEKADAIMKIFSGYKITFLDAPEVENAQWLRRDRDGSGLSGPEALCLGCVASVGSKNGETACA